MARETKTNQMEARALSPFTLLETVSYLLAKTCDDDLFASGEVQAFGNTEKEAKDSAEAGIDDAVKKLQTDPDLACWVKTCDSGKCKFDYAVDETVVTKLHGELKTKKHSKTVKAKYQASVKVWAGCFCVEDAH